MNITRIDTRDFRSEDFTPEEVDAMRRDASTSATMNKVRHDVGIRSADVVIRGDDKSNAELKKEWEAHDLPHGFGEIGAEQIFTFLEGTIGELGSPLLFALSAGHVLADAEKRGLELGRNNERGAMHLAMLTAIDLPRGYKNVEVARWKEAGTGSTSGATRMGTALGTFDRKDAALLQLHSDRGMSAARALCDAKTITRDGDDAQTKRAIDADPALRAKIDADPAFRAGFDSLVWALRHDTAAYEDARAKLQARDARYAQHSVSVRG